MGPARAQASKVVQFKDAERNKFIAVAVDGKVIRYGSLAERKRYR